ncbi:MAG: gliding motility-associated C-terminal domain-containing protein [Bacteroidetes bacterium]|nr:gliding motility-associated C-terminal domain-containing protein [Bacteroidota bacterium]
MTIKQFLNSLKKIACSGILAILLAHAAYAQSGFQAVFGGSGRDEARTINLHYDGDFILTGWTQSFGIPQIEVYILKIDTLGRLKWSVNTGDSSGAVALRSLSAHLSKDSGLVVFGDRGSSNSEFYLSKFDKNTVLQWSKNYGTPFTELAGGVTITNDNGFIFGGQTDTMGGPISFVVKVDSLGNKEWSMAYDVGVAATGDLARAIIQTKDSGYAFVGAGGGFWNSDDFYLVKIDTVGNIMWNKAWGGSVNDGARDLIENDDGSLVIVGYTGSYGSGGRDILLIKTDSEGSLLWSKTYGGALSEDASSLTKTLDGGYAIAGYSMSFGAGVRDAYLVKVDSVGQLLWSRVYGGVGTELILSIKATADSGFVLAGYTESFGAGDRDVYLIKVDAQGWSGCHEDTAATIVTTPALLDTSGAFSFLQVALVTNNVDSVDTPATIDSILCCYLGAGFLASNTCAEDSTVFADFAYGDNIIRYWDFGDGSKDTFFTSTSPGHYYALADTYLVTYVVTHSIISSCSDTFTQQIIVYPPVSVDLGNDTLICSGETINLDAGNTAAGYLWSTGDTGQQILVTQGGNYSVVVADTNNCQARDTVRIQEQPLPMADIPPDTVLCEGDTLLLDAIPIIGDTVGLNYLWTTGDTTRIISVLLTGLYAVDITDSLGCTGKNMISVMIEECPPFFIPNVVTPNNDGANQVWAIEPGDFTLDRLEIYNRWGQLIFQTDNVNTGWDGTHTNNRIELASSTYYYILHYRDDMDLHKKITGFISLLR